MKSVIESSFLFQAMFSMIWCWKYFVFRVRSSYYFRKKRKGENLALDEQI